MISLSPYILNYIIPNFEYPLLLNYSLDKPQMLDQWFAWNTIPEILKLHEIESAYPQNTKEEKKQVASMVSEGATDLDRLLKDHEPKLKAPVKLWL